MYAYKEKTPIEELIIIEDEQENEDQRSLQDKKFPLITVLKCPSTGSDSHVYPNEKSHEMAVRYGIYSIVFDKKYSSLF